MIGSYIERLAAGEDISRPREAVIAERDRVTDEHRSQRSPKSRQAYDKGPRACAHRLPLHRKPQLLHRALVLHDLLEQGAGSSARSLAGTGSSRTRRMSSISATRRSALRSRRFGGRGAAAAPGRRGAPATGPPSWPGRKSIYAAMCQWAPPSVLGRVPETITDPVTIMLWGITTDRIEEWLTSSGDHYGRTRRAPRAPRASSRAARG